ncbi:MAG: polyphenol oxidase family protein [Halobacteriovoraceae bacterium]|nr:polyphenol oxidase family protein [Halobacteriovoraceae bacterium]
MNDIRPVFSRKLPLGRFDTYTQRPSFSFIEVKQIHKKNFFQVPIREGEDMCADGIYTFDKGYKIPLCIKTADCLPVAVIGKKGVAMIHAGWRGIARGILIGGEMKEIMAEYFFIGPHISGETYEVKDDFKRVFPDSPHFLKIGQKIFFNLAAEACRQINSVFPEAKVENCNICTYSHADLHSFRREKNHKQSNWNILTL